jgi:hypothetical protein
MVFISFSLQYTLHWSSISSNVNLCLLLSSSPFIFFFASFLASIPTSLPPSASVSFLSLLLSAPLGSSTFESILVSKPVRKLHTSFSAALLSKTCSFILFFQIEHLSSVLLSKSMIVVLVLLRDNKHWLGFATWPVTD